MQWASISRQLCRRTGLACLGGLYEARRGRQPPATAAPRAACDVLSGTFVLDSCATGQRRRCLTAVDAFVHVCLAINAGGSIRYGRGIENAAA